MLADGAGLMTRNYAGINARAHIQSLFEAEQQILLQPRRGFVCERDDLSSRGDAAHSRTVS